MKKFISFFLILISLLGLSPKSFAYSSKAISLIDASNERILFSDNGDKRLKMASTTKIMTAIVAIENGKLEKEYKIPAVAIGVEGSSMYLIKGEKLTLRELLYGLMLTSGNDAAVAIAYCLGRGKPEKFIELMNKKAKMLGLKNTKFENPNGLDSKNHFTSSNDLAKITAYALKNKTFCEIVKTKVKKIRKDGIKDARVLKNHNKLLSICEGCIGVKTGFTKKSGRCLVSAAKRNGITLICVTLSDPNDWKDHMDAYDKWFAKYKRVKVLSKGDIIRDIKVASANSVKVINNEEKYISVLKDDKIETKVCLPRFIYAPKNKGDKVGSVDFYINNKKISSVSLVLTQNIVQIKQKRLFISKILSFFTSFFLK